MSQNVWLLVEWVDERNVIPSYGIVNVGSLIGMMTQLDVGKLISVRDNRLNANRRARIFNISDKKHYLIEQIKNLERDERDVQNVLSLCMRMMRRLNPETMYTGLMSSDPRASSSGASPLPVVIAGNESTSSSETESEPNFDRYGIGRRYRYPARVNNIIFNNTHISNNLNKIHYRNAQLNNNNNNFNENDFNQGSPLNDQRRHSIVCSTPIPTVNGSTHKAILTFDQGTQTDDTLEQLQNQKIEQMESLLKALYIRFMTFVKQEKNINNHYSSSSSCKLEEIKQNGVEPKKDKNKIESSPEQNEMGSPPEQNEATGLFVNSDYVKGQLTIRGEVNSDTKMLQAHRMSAQPNFGNSNEITRYGIGRRYRNPTVAKNSSFNNTHFNNNFNTIHYKNAQFNNKNFNGNCFSQDAPLNGHSSISRPYSHHQTPFQRSRSIFCSTPIPTNDQGTQMTQTDDTLEQLKKQKIGQMESLLKTLHIHFVTLVAQLNNINNSYSPSSGKLEEIVSSPAQHGIGSPPEQNGGTGALLNPNVNVQMAMKEEYYFDAKMVQVRRMSAQPSFPNNNELVPIGAGNALVPRRILNDINWSSYSVATRQLLQAVFPRRILATHSLTGKPSPAFVNKPAKGRLDPFLVNDIVDTVSERCGVLKSLVRSSITIKCADESKLYRNRQQLNQTRAEINKQEIILPALPAQKT